MLPETRVNAVPGATTGNYLDRRADADTGFILFAIGICSENLQRTLNTFGTKTTLQPDGKQWSCLAGHVIFQHVKPIFRALLKLTF